MFKTVAIVFRLTCYASVIQRSLLIPLLPLALGACSVLSGGGSAPPPKELAKLDISIKADSNLNQDIQGRGAPMLVRVYELKSEVAFQEADFFALQNSDKAALGADLLAVDQYIIRPGETRKILRKSHPETTAIGIFAGYRDLPSATWRVVHKMPPTVEVSWYRVLMPANKAKLRIDLQGNAILMTDEDAGKQPVEYANESLKGLESNPLESVKQQVEGVNPKVADILQSPLKSLPKSPLDALKQVIKP